MKHDRGSSARGHGRRKIEVSPLQGGETAADLVDRHFNAYNAARVWEICRLLKEKVLVPDVTVGVSLSGAMIPAGLASSLIPLMEKGFIDYMISTGANLYHDTHFGLGFDLFRSTPFADDVELFRRRIIRIYDITFDLDVLLESDKFVYSVIDQPEFQKTMATSELHHLLGKYVDRAEKECGRQGQTLLGAAYRCQVPIYTSSPGDSTIGMNIAARRLTGGALQIDVSRDVNETAAIVYEAKRTGASAVLILGGGSPKNFILQTEPQLQEVLGLEVKGHDYFMQITDARPDTGGLSGATPGEAVSWGKVDPDRLPDSVVCYADTTLVLPLVASYALTRCEPRPLKRLYARLGAMLDQMSAIYGKQRSAGKRARRGTAGLKE
ncbi:MAG TPA: deoxyhypusine synthase [Candidatus Polarisedimenticolia bacterium]|nr:deoxyhypusine synthase [Candidatus Polarisedimenticolia bacterium]